MTYCYCDYDRPAWVRSSLYHSKRSRRCEECGCRINAGDKYEYTAGKWSGDVSTFSTCINCRDLRVWTVNNVPCACWEYGNVFEGLKYAIEEACYRAPDETKGLWFGFMRRLAKIRITRRQQMALDRPHSTQEALTR